MEHTPVLLKEVIQTLVPKEGDIVLDVTVGLGGHAAAFLERIAGYSAASWFDSAHHDAAARSDGFLIGIDADGENLEVARKNLEPWKGQVELRQGNFCDPLTLTLSREERGVLHSSKVDILFADLGLSSPHIDDPSRGFTFREDAPLDMRFDRTHGEPAFEFLRRISEEELAHVFWKFGELRSSRKLARAVKQYAPLPHPSTGSRTGPEGPSGPRTAGQAPLPVGEGKHCCCSTVITTFALKNIVEEVYGWRAPRLLPQVFQALRIAVNDELGALEVLLKEGPRLLKPGGRMGVISYHSLEDRMVKQAFRILCTPEKDLLTGAVKADAPFKLLTRKPIRPSDDEIRRNPRARSAKFRALCSTAPS